MHRTEAEAENLGGPNEDERPDSLPNCAKHSVENSHSLHPENSRPVPTELTRDAFNSHAHGITVDAKNLHRHLENDEH